MNPTRSCPAGRHAGSTVVVVLVALAFASCRNPEDALGPPEAVTTSEASLAPAPWIPTGGPRRALDIPPPAHTGHEPSAPGMGNPYVILRPDRNGRTITYFHEQGPGGTRSKLTFRGWKTRFRRFPVGKRVTRHLVRADTDALNHEPDDGDPVCIEAPELKALIEAGATWFDCESTIWAVEFRGRHVVRANWSDPRDTFEPLTSLAGSCSASHGHRSR